MSKVYGYIQENIIRKLEEAIKEGGVAPWQKPWDSKGYVNYLTRKSYRGINLWLLPETGEYITYNQIKEIQKKNNLVKVKKGSKKHMIVFWSVVKGKKKEDEEEEKESFILRYYNVFNINDVEGLESKFEEKEENHSPIEKAEEIINKYETSEGVKIEIRKGSNRAYYSPLGDYISVPDKSQYKNIAEYYSTLFHEIVHSTGHSKRLNRFSLAENHSFGSQAYSKEELIAEMGASMLIGGLGINEIDFLKAQKNSIAYLKSWLEVIKSDEKIITIAAQKSQKAVDYITGKEEEQSF